MANVRKIGAEERSRYHPGRLRRYHGVPWGAALLPSGMTDELSPRTAALAYLQVILAGSLWATSGPFSIALFRLGIPPTSVALLRPLVGTAFLALFLLAMRGRSAFRLPVRAILPLFVAGGVVVGIFQLSYQMSTEAVGVPATVALLYLGPAYVVGMSALLLGERLTLARGGLALLSILGVWLTVFGARGVDVDLTLRGILWGCASGVTYGTYTLFGKRYGREHGPLVPLFWSTLGGTILLTVAWVVRSEPVVLPDSARSWGLLLTFGLFTIAVAALLLFNAMRTLEAGRASIGTTVEPFVAALLAMLLLDQTLTPTGWVGLAVLVIGVAGAYAAGPARPSATGRG